MAILHMTWTCYYCSVDVSFDIIAWIFSFNIVVSFVFSFLMSSDRLS